jgi:hypothetical protein
VAKIVLEVSEELKGLEAPLQALIAEAERRLVDGKAGRRVDYELFEQRLMERTAALELALHRAALAALDLDVERVLINDREHVRVGRYPGEYGTQAGPRRGRAVAVSSAGRTQRPNGGSGDLARGRDKRWLVAWDGTRHGAFAAARHVARGAANGATAGSIAVLTLELRARGPRRGRNLHPEAVGHRRPAHPRLRGAVERSERERLARSGERSHGRAQASLGRPPQKGCAETLGGPCLPNGLLRYGHAAR